MDLKQLFELAGVDTTKGIARQLLEDTRGTHTWWISSKRKGLRLATPEDMSVVNGRILAGIEDIVKDNVGGLDVIVSEYEIFIRTPKEWQEEDVNHWITTHNNDLVMW